MRVFARSRVSLNAPIYLVYTAIAKKGLASGLALGSTICLIISMMPLYARSTIAQLGYLVKSSHSLDSLQAFVYNERIELSSSLFS